MSGKHSKLVSSAALIIVTACAAIVFASTRTNIDRPAEEAAPAAVTKPEPSKPDGEGDSRADQMRRALLTQRFRPELSALGDRIEKAGKERLTLAGTLQRPGDAQAVSFTATYQHPGLLKFEDQSGTRIVYFNGRKAGKVLTAEEVAIVEVLVYDTADGFFDGQMDGMPLRLLGRGFRSDDGSSENYAGPFHDIYQVTSLMKLKGDVLERDKLFYFNSNTQLLEFVRYQIEAGGVVTEVEVRFEDWRKTQDQMIPMRVVRLENNEPVLTFTVTSATVDAKADGGVFSAGQNQ